MTMLWIYTTFVLSGVFFCGWAIRENTKALREEKEAAGKMVSTFLATIKAY